jgi:hypothetical protein
MAYVKRHAVAVTTDASGDVTAYTPAVNGFVHAVMYEPDGSSPLATGADITVTGSVSAIPVVTVTNLGTSAVAKYPRDATADVADAASLYAAAGEPVEARIPVADESVKIVVAQGGNAKSGTFHVYIEG